MKKGLRALSASVIFLAAGCGAGTPARIEIVEEPPVTQATLTLPTRRGVHQRVLIVQGEKRASAVLLILPGGGGTGHARATPGGVRRSNDLLVRVSSEIAQHGALAAIVDAPSDRASGMSDGFRTSPQHLSDIETVLRYFAGRYRQPIFLAGTSESTLSLAYLATALREPVLRGFLWLSSVRQVGALPLEKIRYPVLLVHHRDDPCASSPYAEARRFYGRLTSSLVRDFVTVVGSAGSFSAPCDAAGPHGFAGKEREVAQVILDWMSGRQVPSTVGP